MSFAPWKFPQLRLEPGSTKAYGFSVFCIATAASLRAGVGWIGDDIAPFPTFYPAVMIATLVGGMHAGILATVIGGIVGWWAFMPPYYAFALMTHGQAVSLALYGLASLIIVAAADHYTKIGKRLEDEEALRMLAVEELSHRLKNKIATVQAVISLKLRNSPQVRDDLQRLLRALSATDDLIMTSQGCGVHINDIIETELKPYDDTRIRRGGPNVFLPPKLATTMGLLIHELTTNAAKYGALSTPVGHLSIIWSVSEGRMTIDWIESDGPKVTPSTVDGFGTRLLARALDQFGGAIERDFSPTGLTCKMSLVLPSTTNSGSPTVQSGSGRAEHEGRAAVPRR